MKKTLFFLQKSTLYIRIYILYIECYDKIEMIGYLYIKRKLKDIYNMYLCFFISKAFGSISYEIYPFPKDKKLRIKLEFTSPNSNQTELYIPHQVWGHDLSNQIKIPEYTSIHK